MSGVVRSRNKRFFVWNCWRIFFGSLSQDSWITGLQNYAINSLTYHVITFIYVNKRQFAFGENRFLGEFSLVECQPFVIAKCLFHVRKLQVLPYRISVWYGQIVNCVNQNFGLKETHKHKPRGASAAVEWLLLVMAGRSTPRCLVRSHPGLGICQPAIRRAELVSYRSHNT